MEINTINNDIALLFLRTHRAHKEQISISPADKWLGAFDNTELLGVIGLQMIGKTARIKGFYVRDKSRKQGIGSMLMKQILPKVEATAFATAKSCGIFYKNGFRVESVNKNGVVFMRRTIS